MSDKDYRLPTTLSLGKTIFLGLFAVIIIGTILVVLTGIITIDVGEAGLVFDKQKGVIEAVPLTMGWHWVNPVFKDVIILDTRVQKQTLTLDAASSDSQIVTTEVTLNFQIPAGSWPWVYKEIGDMDMVMMKIVDPTIKEGLKASAAKFKGEVLIPERGAVKIKVQESLEATLGESKIFVTEVSLTDFKFNDDYQDAIERKQMPIRMP